ncbi:MAG: class I SAM-dependent methyltransferase [candidate division Zixibacteria bacterium]|nr:class I SAM-dependent methyltransferase [candidate division Zixibacteria bacterium]
MLFEKYADDYARLRPVYPDDLIGSLIARFKLKSNSLILDLACGTGNLRRQLQNTSDGNVLGLDRSLIMLAHCQKILSACSKAERLPVKSGLLDAVVVGQAFHWFDFKAALDEINRCLKSGGGLAIIWYRRKKPLAGHRLKMSELVKRLNPDYKPSFMDYDWPEILISHSGFADIDKFAAECVIKYSIADYLKLQRSKSYVGDAMSPEVLARYFIEGGAILSDEYPDGVVPEEMQFYYVSAIKA